MLTERHRCATLIPASNDLTETNLEGERLLTRILGAPELGTFEMSEKEAIGNEKEKDEI